MNLACVLCRMTLTEVLVAATINAGKYLNSISLFETFYKILIELNTQAAALGKHKTHGSLQVGKYGDLLILNAPRFVPPLNAFLL